MSCGDLATPRGVRSPRFGGQAQSSGRPLPSARGGRQLPGGTSSSQPPAGAESMSLSARLSLSAGTPTDAPGSGRCDGGSSRRPNPLLGNSGNTPASARAPQRPIRSPPISPLPASAREAPRYEQPLPSPPLHRRGGREDRIFDRNVEASGGSASAQVAVAGVLPGSPPSPLVSPSPNSAAMHTYGAEGVGVGGDVFSRRDTNDPMCSPVVMSPAEEPPSGSITCDKIQELCGKALRLVYDMGTPAVASGALSYVSAGQLQGCEGATLVRSVPEQEKGMQAPLMSPSDRPAVDCWEIAMAEIADLRSRTLRAEAALDQIRQDGQRCTNASPGPVFGEATTLGREFRMMGSQLAEMREEVQRTNNQIWALVQHLSHTSALNLMPQQHGVSDVQQGFLPTPFLQSSPLAGSAAMIPGAQRLPQAAMMGAQSPLAEIARPSHGTPGARQQPPLPRARSSAPREGDVASSGSCAPAGACVDSFSTLPTQRDGCREAVWGAAAE